MSAFERLPPRPQDPDLLYAAFTSHQATCRGCGNGGCCPYAENLLLAWGSSEDFYAQERAAIEAARKGIT